MALVGAVLVLGSLSVWPMAQPMSEAALKADFLFNFAKFAEWPEEVLSPTAPIVLCVTAPDVGAALETVVTGRLLNQHPLVVSRVKLGESLRSCVILYAGKLDNRRTAQLAATLGGASVLTVGDAQGFAESGGMIAFLEADGRIRFAVNLGAVERTRIRLSAKLLALATIVGGDR
jgi:hypothetical protein